MAPFDYMMSGGVTCPVNREKLVNCLDVIKRMRNDIRQSFWGVPLTVGFR